MNVPGNGDVVSLLSDEGGYMYGSVQDFAPKKVLWLVRMEGCPRDTFFNFVRKRHNRKFESGSPRKSRCFRTSVVEPNNLTRISGDLQFRKLSYYGNSTTWMDERVASNSINVARGGNLCKTK